MFFSILFCFCIFNIRILFHFVFSLHLTIPAYLSSHNKSDGRTKIYFFYHFKTIRNVTCHELVLNFTFYSLKSLEFYCHKSVGTLKFTFYIIIQTNKLNNIIQSNINGQIKNINYINIIVFGLF